jgi:hypothetical protein
VKNKSTELIVSHDDNVLTDILWLERFVRHSLRLGRYLDCERKEAIERIENVKDRFQDAVGKSKPGH